MTAITIYSLHYRSSLQYHVVPFHWVLVVLTIIVITIPIVIIKTLNCTFGEGLGLEKTAVEGNVVSQLAALREL